VSEQHTSENLNEILVYILLVNLESL
jgi:hypothetical protein